MFKLRDLNHWGVVMEDNFGEKPLDINKYSTKLKIMNDLVQR